MYVNRILCSYIKVKNSSPVYKSFLYNNENKDDYNKPTCTARGIEPNIIIFSQNLALYFY